LSSEKNALIDEAVTAMNQVFHAVQTGVLPSWLQVEITMGQCKAAMFLAHQGPMTIGQLACALRTGQPAASILVDRLVQLGLVQRTEDPADRRRTFVQLSSAGQEVVDSFHRYRVDFLSELIRRMDVEDLGSLVRGLNSLAAVATEQQPPPGSGETVIEARPAHAASAVSQESEP